MLQISGTFRDLLKFFGSTADKLTMDISALIQIAVPTPFGWVITTEEDVDLDKVLAFQGQLLALARVCGTAVPVADAVAERLQETARENEPVGVLVPLRAA